MICVCSTATCLGSSSGQWCRRILTLLLPSVSVVLTFSSRTLTDIHTDVKCMYFIPRPHGNVGRSEGNSSCYRFSFILVFILTAMLLM
jgi:hypothetical protein